MLWEHIGEALNPYQGQAGMRNKQKVVRFELTSSLPSIEIARAKALGSAGAQEAVLYGWTIVGRIGEEGLAEVKLRIEKGRELG